MASLAQPGHGYARPQWGCRGLPPATDGRGREEEAMETPGLKKQDQDSDSGTQREEYKLLTHARLIGLLIKVPLLTCDIDILFYRDRVSCSSG